MKYIDIQRSIYIGLDTTVPYFINLTVDTRTIDTDIFFYIKGILFWNFFQQVTQRIKLETIKNETN